MQSVSHSLDHISSFQIIQIKNQNKSLNMSKRNRRRTRGGARKSVSMSMMMQPDSFELPGLHDPPDPSSRAAMNPQIRRNDITARHWHNRYIAWQVRERRQKEEQERLKQEQRRIFGGDSQDGGEDADSLCSSMMAFFDGLDYLREDGLPGS